MSFSANCLAAGILLRRLAAKTGSTGAVVVARVKLVPFPVSLPEPAELRSADSRGRLSPIMLGLARSQKLAASSFSLPLNRPRRFRRDVVDHSVHALYLIHDPRGHGLEHFMRERNPVGRHAVFGTHSADGAGVRVSAHVAHHTDGHHWQQHSKRLPDLVVEAGFFDLADHNVITLAQQREALGSDFSEYAHCEARPRKRLALENLLGHAEIAADLADFVLE